MSKSDVFFGNTQKCSIVVSEDKTLRAQLDELAAALSPTKEMVVLGPATLKNKFYEEFPEDRDTFMVVLGSGTQVRLCFTHFEAHQARLTALAPEQIEPYLTGPLEENARACILLSSDSRLYQEVTKFIVRGIPHTPVGKKLITITLPEGTRSDLSADYGFEIGELGATTANGDRLEFKFDGVPGRISGSWTMAPEEELAPITFTEIVHGDRVSVDTHLRITQVSSFLENCKTEADLVSAIWSAGQFYELSNLSYIEICFPLECKEKIVSLLGKSRTSVKAPNDVLVEITYAHAQATRDRATLKPVPIFGKNSDAEYITGKLASLSDEDWRYSCNTADLRRAVSRAARLLRSVSYR